MVLLSRVCARGASATANATAKFIVSHSTRRLCRMKFARTSRWIFPFVETLKFVILLFSDFGRIKMCN
jgi:hypothetical protein